MRASYLWGSVFRAESLGARVPGLGFQVLGIRPMVKVIGFRAEG